MGRKPSETPLSPVNARAFSLPANSR